MSCGIEHNTVIIYAPALCSSADVFTQAFYFNVIQKLVEIGYVNNDKFRTRGKGWSDHPDSELWQNFEFKVDYLPVD